MEWKYVCQFSVTLLLLQSWSSSATMNVLFLVADDMRPELESFYGPDFASPINPPMYTPNLDKLAAKSLVLKRAYVQQALCSPSRTSLLTGRRPDTTHVYDLQHYFRKVGGNYTTIPQHFKDNGYKSIGMGKIFHPGKAASGNDDPISWSEQPYFHGVNNFESLEHSWLAVSDEELNTKPLIDQQIATHAKETLRRVAAESGEQPFFVAAGFHKPNLPFVFPSSFLAHYPESSIRLPDNPYAPVDMPSVAWFPYEDLRQYDDIKKLNASGAINTTLPGEVVRSLRRAYYSALSWTDSLIGQVMDELDELGLSNSTIVSFWGDHGWQLGEHGEWCKQTNFDIATHAPMMVHIPGVTDNGVQTHQLTEFIDLFPTLVEAAGLPSLPLCPRDSTQIQLCREGTSMLPLIQNPDKPIKTAAFSQYPRSPDKDSVMGYTVRTDKFNGTYRYTEWPEFHYAPDYKPNWNKLFGVELYDHQNDPGENHNRANDPSYLKIRSQLSKLLREGRETSIGKIKD